MIKYIFLIGLTLLSVRNTIAQSYKTAAGIQIGTKEMGLSIQQKIIDKVSIEGIAEKRSQDWNPSKAIYTATTFTALVRKHKYIVGRAFNGYIGIGGHKIVDKTIENSYGLDGIVGIEGTIFYLNTSIAYRPILSFQADKKEFQNQFAVSVRYVFVRAPFSKKNKKGYAFPVYRPIWT